MKIIRQMYYQLSLFTFLGCFVLGVSTSVQANQAPDCSNARASGNSNTLADTSILWPNNNSFVNVEILDVVDADSDPLEITIQCIFQDEPLGLNSRRNILV